MSIRVNDCTIDDEAIRHEMAHHPAQNPDQSREQAARALVVRELLLQQARSLHPLSDDADDEARIEALLASEVAVPEPKADECERYYEANRTKFRSETLFELAHILLPADPRDAEARDVARSTAEELIATLQAEPDRFAELARAHSACPSKETGGSLGQIGRGQTVPEFESALEKLPLGLAAQPLESRYGLHVVQVARRVEGEQLPFEAVEQQIAEYLRERVRHRALHQYVQLLAGEAEIEGIELEGATSPLLQ